MAAGKTSNLELDAIYSRYLPKGSVLRCDTFPNLTEQLAEELQQRLLKRGMLYFPIFLRHHWIAGILRFDKTQGFTLTTHDSAPSACVHRDLMRKLKGVWPQLTLLNGRCNRQERGSEDCGIHMTAVFFSIHTNTELPICDTLGKRLRKFLTTALRLNFPRGDFIHGVVEILNNTSYEMPLEGGGEKRKETSRTQKERQGNTPSLPEPSAATVQTPQRRGRPRGSHKPLPTSETTTTDERSVTFKVQQMLNKAKEVENSTASRNLCYFLAATAMVNVGDGGNRSLEIDALANQAIRKGFKSGTQYDVGETLAVYGKELDFLIVTEDGGPMALLDRFGNLQRPPNEAWYVQTPGSNGMPVEIDTHVFRIGAKYTGMMVQHRMGVSAGTEGHYSLTCNAEESVFGVYLPKGFEIYEKTGTRRLPRKGITVDKAPVQSRAERPRAQTKASDNVDETDLAQVLKDPVPAGLNALGLRQEGMATSPEAWYVYQGKPYFVQQTAWNAKTKATRDLHIRWLNEIKSMPREYLSRDLPHAIMEYVRWIAVKRGWKWATYAKNLTSIESALENLPLYTNQKTGIRLRDCPEWRENLSGAQLKEHESEAEPPAPVTITDYEKIRKGLELTHPTEALFLTMMWMFAARPADIIRLRVRDVNFSSAEDTENVLTQLTIREGKAVKFRGPYPISSILPRKYASILQTMMNNKSRKQRIFENADSVRTRVLQEIHTVVPQANLSSLRKGAAMHLASSGVSEEELMRLTGHTQLKTLRKYLQYGLQPTAEDVTAQGNAELLLPQPNS